MRGKRRASEGFERLGALPAHALGLPAARARELRLAEAWRSVCGEMLARKAQASLRRGVLEVALVDPAWRQALEELLPELAARVAAHCPELAIQRYRLQRNDERRPGPARPIEGG